MYVLRMYMVGHMCLILNINKNCKLYGKWKKVFNELLMKKKISFVDLIIIDFLNEKLF